VFGILLRPKAARILRTNETGEAHTVPPTISMVIVLPATRLLNAADDKEVYDDSAADLDSLPTGLEDTLNINANNGRAP
jgi:hypothetical protein